MSFHDFEIAKRLDVDGTPCTALLLAAMLRADPTTRERIGRAFPEVRDELEKRAPYAGWTACE
jgi:hypothetical protein